MLDGRNPLERLTKKQLFDVLDRVKDFGLSTKGLYVYFYLLSEHPGKFIPLDSSELQKIFPGTLEDLRKELWILEKVALLEKVNNERGTLIKALSPPLGEETFSFVNDYLYEILGNGPFSPIYFSISEIETFLYCPYKVFLKFYINNAVRKEKSSPELEIGCRLHSKYYPESDISLGNLLERLKRKKEVVLTEVPLWRIWNGVTSSPHQR